MKRFFDFVCSLLAIIILSPLFLILSIVIAADSGRPVIFKQKRVGLHNKLFDIWKFRSMKQGTRNAPTAELKEFESCVTRSGRFLRKTSLDELPQLFNILRGEMSFVGPRPLIPEEGKTRSLREKAGVYRMRPGVTGLAQVNGRDLLSDEQKVAYDAYYVEHHSLLLDLRILFQTVFAVLTGNGIAEGSDTRHRGRRGDKGPKAGPQ